MNQYISNGRLSEVFIDESLHEFNIIECLYELEIYVKTLDYTTSFWTERLLINTGFILRLHIQDASNVNKDNIKIVVSTIEVVLDELSKNENVNVVNDFKLVENVKQLHHIIALMLWLSALRLNIVLSTNLIKKYGIWVRQQLKTFSREYKIATELLGLNINQSFHTMQTCLLHCNFKSRCRIIHPENGYFVATRNILQFIISTDLTSHFYLVTKDSFTIKLLVDRIIELKTYYSAYWDKVKHKYIELLDMFAEDYSHSLFIRDKGLAELSTKLSSLNDELHKNIGEKYWRLSQLPVPVQGYMLGVDPSTGVINEKHLFKLIMEGSSDDFKSLSDKIFKRNEANMNSIIETYGCDPPEGSDGQDSNGYDIFGYNPFDIAYYYDQGVIFIFTRGEFKYLIDNGVNFYNKVPLTTGFVDYIKFKVKLAEDLKLPDPLPITELINSFNMVPSVEEPISTTTTSDVSIEQILMPNYVAPRTTFRDNVYIQRRGPVNSFINFFGGISRSVQNR